MSVLLLGICFLAGVVPFAMLHSAPAEASARVCAVLLQEPHDVYMAAQSCQMVGLAAASVHVCAVLKQKPHNICVASPTSRPQRIIVTSVHVCPVLQEKPYDIRIAEPR